MHETAPKTTIAHTYFYGDDNPTSVSVFVAGDWGDGGKPLSTKEVRELAREMIRVARYMEARSV